MIFPLVKNFANVDSIKKYIRGERGSKAVLRILREIRHKVLRLQEVLFLFHLLTPHIWLTKQPVILS